MAAWTAYPYDRSAYIHDADALRALWPRLHAGDAMPLPEDPGALAAWALYHAGDYEAAVDAGLKAGGAGLTAANRAQCIYADYLETSETTRLALLLAVAERAELQMAQEPQNAYACYLGAYAIGRYSQGISVAHALTQGLGAKVKAALEATLQLQPRHADAHIALGTFHAELIDKLGPERAQALGASRDAGIAAFEAALRLNPASAIARMQYADALVMFDGPAAVARADALYAEAARCEALDATERLHVERARAALHD